MEELMGMAELANEVADAVDAAGEVMEFHDQVQEIQGDLSDSLEETVGDAVDTQHAAIKQNAEASRAAYENKEITWEEHQENIDRNAELLRQVNAGTCDMTEGATQAAQVNIVGEAVLGACKAEAKAAGVDAVTGTFLPERFAD